MLLDANTTYAENDSTDFNVLDKRCNSLQDLLIATVDVAFHQYAISHPGEKLTFSEFCDFVREDASIQSFVCLLPTCLGEGVQQPDTGRLE